jgi:hypothetical protein
MYTERDKSQTYGEASLNTGANILIAAGGVGLALKGSGGGLLGQFSRGAQTSLLGADPLMAASGNNVFAFGSNSGELLSGARRGYGIGFQRANNLGGMTQGVSVDAFTRQGTNVLKSGGLMKMGMGNLALPLIFTGIGAIQGGMEEGIPGIGKYLVQDFLAMDAATKVNNMVFEFDYGNYKKVAKSFKLDKRELGRQLYTKGGQGAVSIQRTALGYQGIGMMRTMVGGVMGASLGMSAGAAAGSFLAEQISDQGYGASAAGFVGGAFGAAAGAKLGAFAGGSFLRMGVIGAGIAATTIVAKGTYSMLESGFKNIGKGRGLNFASDTSNFMTQQAVTMRQRALQAMHKSHLNARSAFGQEATITHMNRDMFSHYKRY